MIRVGIVGAGGMGNVHARQYRKRSDVELSFYDHRASRVEKFASAYDVKPASSIEELIAQTDALDICVPTPAHFDIASRALAAGRPTLVEKPLARTAAQAVELAETAQRAGVTLMPAHVVRFFPEYRKARDLVVEGAIGRPAALRCRRGGGPPSGSEGWFLDHALSGGVLMDLCIHDFDWLRWLTGDVTSLYSRSVAAHSGKGPDYALTTLTFDNGTIGHVEGTWMDPSGFRTHFDLAGSGGLIQHDSRTNVPLRTSTASAENEGAPLPDLDGNLTPTEDPYYLEIDHFLQALNGGELTVVTALDGVNAVAIAEAAIESSRTDRVVSPSRHF